MKKILLLTLLATLLSACSTIIRPDASIAARGQEDRVQFLILHYTALDQAASLRVLSQQEVSAHYLVGNENPLKVWQLVDENRMAYHAGLSEWKGYSRLNASSIGIEIVNLGYQDTPTGRVYYPFPQAQIDQVIALVKSISTRYKIRPQYILGHSDIAPQRKSDPGPLFPWKQLADAGLIPWPYPDEVAIRQVAFEQELPTTLWFQQKLAKIGYTIKQDGVLDEATRNVLIAFQSKYRPANFDGIADAQTAAMIEVLLSKLP
ncbi:MULTISPECIES: N-acetylmuramoyl-L-alanine amidase [unclassified Undibacterium]|uniref:N-acetylmuramoyl-L-alanine amidase n=1 Tax=unclassified Undibacterium TaxID=2630295 RepID=UPI002AC96517|nr:MULTISPECIES: N-acetylmuramoyl-L-alanine amidase [unclassified Undibacterium]MEB0140268.1 N-acetylmuramoyl-L-alanine amidase [Undibacterium sp. CCC2.1]MEB0173318.1 N-acetylmuramoyl-L-alanine amidase [Undibacterium sp. CCC1.1]MEB0177137.1 N-acetylmuramoyl-L-alanine amidase [Undibacterium sp. CCC3.4]MEB0216407.1 N-acetylmuramoyl-L-alanine amidase [Undibacterium sp. 5I2]WPX45538.1 N-acetylmuramoyl-L-alanine amidase [Undibacterium sp. CCC3.4]